MKTEIAIFAAGCFWGVQAVFDQIDGVIDTIAGYTGGNTKDPPYEEICTGTTGHAEAVKIEFNPKKILYNELLDLFWMNHDPTTMNKQGLDIGEQYRSAIFYTTINQKWTAEKSKEKWQSKFKKLIVTEIKEATDFYPAEDYHQRYYKTHNISCHIILPTTK